MKKLLIVSFALFAMSTQANTQNGDSVVYIVESGVMYHKSFKCACACKNAETFDKNAKIYMCMRSHVLGSRLACPNCCK